MLGSYSRLIPLLLLRCACLFTQSESVESRIAVAGLTPEEVRSFVARLQTAVVHHDSGTICTMVAYPISTKGPGRIRTASACRQNYARIFNERVTRAVLSQTFEQLFANWQGVMIGNGEVWISGVCRDKKCAAYDVRIIAVNN